MSCYAMTWANHAARDAQSPAVRAARFPRTYYLPTIVLVAVVDPFDCARLCCRRPFAGVLPSATSRAAAADPGVSPGKHGMTSLETAGP